MVFSPFLCAVKNRPAPYKMPGGLLFLTKIKLKYSSSFAHFSFKKSRQGQGREALVAARKPRKPLCRAPQSAKFPAAVRKRRNLSCRGAKPRKSTLRSSQGTTAPPCPHRNAPTNRINAYRRRLAGPSHRQPDTSRSHQPLRPPSCPAQKCAHRQPAR